MKKKDLEIMYDLDLSEISDTKDSIEQKLPDFMLFWEPKSQMNTELDYKNRVQINQTWSIAGKTYTWFPNYGMYLTTEPM